MQLKIDFPDQNDVSNAYDKSKIPMHWRPIINQRTKHLMQQQKYYLKTSGGTLLNFTKEKYPELFYWFESNKYEILSNFDHDNNARVMKIKLREYSVPLGIQLGSIVYIYAGTTRAICKLRPDGTKW